MDVGQPCATVAACTGCRDASIGEVGASTAAGARVVGTMGVGVESEGEQGMVPASEEEKTGNAGTGSGKGAAMAGGEMETGGNTTAGAAFAQSASCIPSFSLSVLTSSPSLAALETF